MESLLVVLLVKEHIHSCVSSTFQDQKKQRFTENMNSRIADTNQ
jgi:hypothetical protein